MKKIKDAVILAAIPFVIFLSGILVTAFSTSPTITEVPSIQRPGYAATEARVIVEASSHKRFADYFATHWLLVIIGLILAPVATYIAARFYLINALGYLGIWIVCGLIIFLGYALQKDRDYATDISPEQYQAIGKTGVDSLFPIK